eukprot:scaffold1112_cov195-Alexandrium_tamarense.AAC.6
MSAEDCLINGAADTPKPTPAEAAATTVVDEPQQYNNASSPVAPADLTSDPVIASNSDGLNLESGGAVTQVEAEVDAASSSTSGADFSMGGLVSMEHDAGTAVSAEGPAANIINSGSNASLGTGSMTSVTEAAVYPFAASTTIGEAQQGAVTTTATSEANLLEVEGSGGTNESNILSENNNKLNATDTATDTATDLVGNAFDLLGFEAPSPQADTISPSVDAFATFLSDDPFPITISDPVVSEVVSPNSGGSASDLLGMTATDADDVVSVAQSLEEVVHEDTQQVETAKVKEVAKQEVALMEGVVHNELQQFDTDAKQKTEHVAEQIGRDQQSIIAMVDNNTNSESCTAPTNAVEDVMAMNSDSSEHLYKDASGNDSAAPEREIGTSVAVKTNEWESDQEPTEVSTNDLEEAQYAGEGEPVSLGAVNDGGAAELSGTKEQEDTMNEPEHDVLSTHIDDRMTGVTESNNELNEEAAGEEVVPKVADSNATNESASATDPYPTDHDATKQPDQSFIVETKVEIEGNTQSMPLLKTQQDTVSDDDNEADLRAGEVVMVDITPDNAPAQQEVVTEEEEEWLSMGLGLADALRQIVALTDERDAALVMCQEKEGSAQSEALLVEVQSRLQSEMNRRAESDSEVRKLRVKLKQYEERLATYGTMEDDLEKAQANLVMVVSEKSRLEMEIEKLREVKDDAERKEVLLSNRLNEAKKKEANKSTTAGRLEADNEKLKEDLERTIGELDAMTKARAKLEATMEKLKAKAVERVKQAETALAEERELNEERKKKMKVFVETKAEELREAKESAGDMQSELQETRASLRSSREREETFQKELDQSRIKYRELQRDLERLKRNQEEMYKMGSSLEHELEKSASETEEHKKKRMSAKHELMTMVRSLEVERAVSGKLRESMKFTFTPKALSQQQLLTECLRDFEAELERLAFKHGKTLVPPPSESSDRQDSGLGADVGSSEINGTEKRSKKRATKSDNDTERLISNLDQETQLVSKKIMLLVGSIERMRTLLNEDNTFNCMSYFTQILAATGQSEARHTRLEGTNHDDDREEIMSITSFDKGS